MVPAFGRRTPFVVGLDIQANDIVAAEVPHGRGALRRAAIAPLPPGLVREGEIGDPESLGEAIKSLFQEHKLNRRVRMGIGSQRAVVRAIELPAIERREDLEAAVRFQAGERLPMSLDEAVLDFRIIERFADAEGTQRDRVIMVAAPKDIVEGMIHVARKAGLKLIGIDANAFALIRALHGAAGNGNVPVAGEDHDANAGGDQGGEPHALAPALEDAVVYVHLGSLTTFAVAHGANCLFARTLPYGMDAVERQLAERRQVSVDDARRWLAYVGLATDVAELEGDAELVTGCRSVLEGGVEQLASVVQASLDYYASQPEAHRVRKLLVSGPGTEIGGLVEALAAHVPAPVQAAHPPTATNDIPPAQLALAYGLALEEAAA